MNCQLCLIASAASFRRLRILLQDNGCNKCMKCFRARSNQAKHSMHVLRRVVLPTKRRLVASLVLVGFCFSNLSRSYINSEPCQSLARYVFCLLPSARCESTCTAQHAASACRSCCCTGNSSTSHKCSIFTGSPGGVCAVSTEQRLREGAPAVLWRQLQAQCREALLIVRCTLLTVSEPIRLVLCSLCHCILPVLSAGEPHDNLACLVGGRGRQALRSERGGVPGAACSLLSVQKGSGGSAVAHSGPKRLLIQPPWLKIDRQRKNIWTCCRNPASAAGQLAAIRRLAARMLLAPPLPAALTLSSWLMPGHSTLFQLSTLPSCSLAARASSGLWRRRRPLCNALGLLRWRHAGRHQMHCSACCSLSERARSSSSSDNGCLSSIRRHHRSWQASLSSSSLGGAPNWRGDKPSCQVVSAAPGGSMTAADRAAIGVRFTFCISVPASVDRYHRILCLAVNAVCGVEDTGCFSLKNKQLPPAVFVFHALIGLLQVPIADMLVHASSAL